MSETGPMLEEVLNLPFKKRMLTDSDIRIIERHSKKNLSDTVHGPAGSVINYHDEMDVKFDRPLGDDEK